MRRALFWLLMIASMPLTGCDSIQKHLPDRKHDSPVMSQAPRRVDRVKLDEDEEKYVSAAQSPKTRTQVKQTGSEKGDTPTKEFDGTEIKQVSISSSKNPWDDWTDDTTIFNSQVAATVNGAPILNGDVLDRYGGYLISVREGIQKAAKEAKPGQPIPTPKDYEQHRESLIQGQIAGYIQQKLLAERLKSGLKPEQVKMMEGHVDELFEKKISELKKDLKVSNKTELELELNKKGTTLQNVRDNFALETLSRECFAIKSGKPDPIERPDLVAYYQANEDKFAVAAKVRWQQIQVSFGNDIPKKAAKKKLQRAIDELNEGVSFEKVARKYSDGPTAKDGGVWDWMETDNLKDKNLEKKLFSMPLNQLSEIHEGDDSVSVVRVIDRESAGRKPFKDVQQEIRAILEEEQNKKRMKRLLKQLFTNAVIETQYSIPEFVPEE